MVFFHLEWDVVIMLTQEQVEEELLLEAEMRGKVVAETLLLTKQKQVMMEELQKRLSLVTGNPQEDGS